MSAFTTDHPDVVSNAAAPSSYSGTAYEVTTSRVLVLRRDWLLCAPLRLPPLRAAPPAGHAARPALRSYHPGRRSSPRPPVVDGGRCRGVAAAVTTGARGEGVSPTTSAATTVTFARQDRPPWPGSRLPRPRPPRSQRPSGVRTGAPDRHGGVTTGAPTSSTAAATAPPRGHRPRCRP